MISNTLFASSNYMNQGQFQLALENFFGSVTVGVGAKSNSCLLCHSTASGGPGNINNSFGQDFQDAAFRTVGGPGNQLSTTGPNSLVTVLGDNLLRNTDSDGDGDTNEEEFLADTDPADNITGGSGGSSGGGGGCGRIGPAPKNKTGFPPVLLAILPIFVLLILGRKKRIT